LNACRTLPPTTGITSSAPTPGGSAFPVIRTRLAEDSGGITTAVKYLFRTPTHRMFPSTSFSCSLRKERGMNFSLFLPLSTMAMCPVWYVFMLRSARGMPPTQPRR